MRICLCLVCLFVFAQDVSGQVFSNKVVGKKNADLADSLKKAEYPYILPILGKGATRKGFDLPYSAGIGINYLWQESDIIINNLNVGFNHGPMYNLDEIVRFNNTTATSNGLNVRPDVWLFPFLNVYGIFAKIQSTTAVDFGVYVPDASGTWNQVFTTSTTANFKGTTAGFGLTPTIGVAGGFMALDMNWAWTDIEALEKPAASFVFGPRFGKSFRLKDERAVALWVGGFRLHIKSETTGDLPIGDLFDTQGLGAKIDAGMDKVGQAQADVDTWWNSLTPPQQANPVNKAKYETANRAIGAAANFLTSASSAVGNLEQASVQYSLDKAQKNMWNFIVGGQYQFNKAFMIRAEGGFLNSRVQFLAGLQYRFPL